MAAKQWISQACPILHPSEWNKSNLIKIDDNSLVFATRKGICSFSTKWNKWTQRKVYLSYSKDSDFSIAYNANSKDIFISTSDGVIILNLSRSETQKFSTSPWCCSPQLICISSLCHAIGRGEHKIFDNKTNDWQDMDKFTGYHDERHFGLIFDSKRNELLLFGGQVYATWEYLDNIYKYSLVNRKWIKLEIKLPRKMRSFGYIITKDQQYIIIMGGRCKIEQIDEIYVFNLKSMKFIQSKIKLPFKGECSAVIMEDKQENDLLVHGFIRKGMNKYKINIPFALISLIVARHSTEYIYVMNEGFDKHWKINVDKLFN